MKNILFVSLIVLFTSCFGSEPIIKSVKKVLVAKTVEPVNATALSSGYTDYVLAFNDGWTESTTFGYYNCLQIGDTIEFIVEATPLGYSVTMKPKCE